MENAKRGKRIAELEECLLTAEERLEQMTRERDEAREQLYLTKAELGRWVDRETKAVRERESYQNRVARLEESIVTSLGQRLEPCMSRHPVTVVMSVGSLFAKIGEAIGCEFEDGDDLLESVKELTRERDEARADAERYLTDLRRCASEPYERTRELEALQAEVERLRTEVASSLAMASAEADVLRGFGCMEDGDGPCGVCRECFYRHGYRRGAEAMREACARMEPYAYNLDDHLMISKWRSLVRALPIPEEK